MRRRRRHKSRESELAPEQKERGKTKGLRERTDKTDLVEAGLSVTRVEGVVFVLLSLVGLLLASVLLHVLISIACIRRREAELLVQLRFLELEQLLVFLDPARERKKEREKTRRTQEERENKKKRAK